MAIRADEIEVGDRGAVDIDRDRRLVVRHQDGDHAAFDELYRRYHDRLVHYCHRRVGDRHVAEELAQEAFVRAFRAMPTFAGERRFYPWVTVIAQRLCIDHHRHRERVEPSATVDTGVVEADHEDLWASVDRSHLTDAVARLAPRHREILELREQRGWSYQDIATHLGAPLTTIEALLHRARKALRREYLAVAGDDAAGRLAAFGGLAAVLARAKGWIAAIGADRWAPAAGALAAGVTAVGLVGLPNHRPPAPTPDETVIIADAAPATARVTGTSSGAVGAVTTDVGGLGAGAAGPGPAATSRPAAGRPDPSFEAGPLAVFGDEAGQAYVDEQVEAMPVVVELGPIRVGLDPANLVGLTMEPEPSQQPPSTTTGGTGE